MNRWLLAVLWGVMKEESGGTVTDQETLVPPSWRRSSNGWAVCGQRSQQLGDRNGPGEGQRWGTSFHIPYTRMPFLID